MTILYIEMINHGPAREFNPSEVTYIWTDGVGDCHFAVKIGEGHGLAGHFTSKHPSPSDAMNPVELEFAFEQGFVLTNYYQPTKGGMGHDRHMPSYHKLRTNTLAMGVGVDPLVARYAENTSFVYVVESDTVYGCPSVDSIHRLHEGNVETVIASGEDMTHVGDYEREVNCQGSQGSKFVHYIVNRG